MNDPSGTTVAHAGCSQDVSPVQFPLAALRQSVGLVEFRHEAAALEEPATEQPSSDEDLLQFFLAIESSRQETETYNRYLNTVVRESARARVEAESAARKK